MASAAVCSKTEVLLLIHFFIVAINDFGWGGGWGGAVSDPCFVFHAVVWLLVFCVSLTVLVVGPQCVIVVLPRPVFAQA